MTERLVHLTLFGIGLLVLGGCAHAISRENRQSALTNLSPVAVLEDFETYKGRLVLMGGEIITTKNLASETRIELLQKPLSRITGRPLDDKNSNGRFIVKYKAFKDPYVFSQGRKITVAGIVAAKEVSKIDETEYTYLVLEDRETYLWPEQTDYYGAYPYGYPYYPYWYPYEPWWPYWYPRRYRH
jgi:outer membrane lipoprotein